ncbi:MAG: LLM class flavin-dependent oxidoreductase [Candidatus Thorarchaeota archaeon]|jgi:alkanesulfonate monooxygenase SsuD/methylene tetrahydromethanopterin reductase-like flavin-dependent oxidoreductase (luciferase family)
MKYGIYISNYALQGSPNKFLDLAVAAEDAGWDGFFMWDHNYAGKDLLIADPWITLAAIAARTEKIRIGTTVTPLPRRRPEKVAREVATLDILSKGRFILGVGLGGSSDNDYSNFGEDVDLKARAEKLDESLAILEGLWSGKPFSFSGKHYTIEEVTFNPRPIQRPRVPIWCAGTWPIKAPFRRAARYDGVFPLGITGNLELDDYSDIVNYVKNHRESMKDYDIVILGQTTGDPEKDSWVEETKTLGMTWYVEVMMGDHFDKFLARIVKGPF